MKNFNFFKKILTFTLIILNVIYINHVFIKNNNVYASLSYNDTAEIVMELNSNRILHQKNAFDKKYMASTTKILTAITIIENCNIDDIITVSKQTVGIEGSSIYLEEGENLSVKDLLYGLMLRSGNDCAETLAVHCSKSISNFANLMNDTANKIGAKQSNFVNPHGLHDNNHYTTAYDLALISCHAMKNNIFREIVGTKEIDIPFTTKNCNRHLINKNKMLYQFDGATGIKTGYTKKAGRCLVSSCFRNGMEIICVVLNCPPMFEKSKELLSNAFNNYYLYKIVDKTEIFDFLPVENTDVLCGLTIKNDIILPLTKYECSNIKIMRNYPKILKKPIEKDKELGVVQIYCENNLLFEEKIYTILEIK